MVCCKVNVIKVSTKIHMDTFILVFFRYYFGVDNMRFVPMLIVKKIVLTCLICTTTVYHQSELYIPGFL